MIEVRDRIQFVAKEAPTEFIVIPEIVRASPVAENLTRRKFLIKGGLTLGKIFLSGSLIDVMVGCATPQSADSSFLLPRLKEPSKPFGELSVGDSIDFVIKEIQSHSKLGSLKEYDPKKLHEFAGQAYNIWAKTTNSRINPDELLSKTAFGNVSDIEKSYRDYQKSLGLTAGFSSDKSDKTAAITYPLDGYFDDLRIILNQDYIAFLPEGFSLDSMTYINLYTDKIMKSYSNKHFTRLGVLLYIFTHEPFHFETGLQPINPPLNVGEYSYSAKGGLRLTRKNLSTNIVDETFTTLDEVSIYLTQRGLIAPVLSEVYEQYGKPQDILDTAATLFRKLGYSTPREILELRRSGKSIFQLTQKVGFDNLSKFDELLSKNDINGLKVMVDKL